ncbi:RNA polymerase sigma factor [Roseibium aggregatum]|uniref:RNA polymerase sigma factor n=1 Tax=Roseibium aggregatum TaxID=187304 RepID=A0A939EHP7_9HYPH|nr:RNA polymerase sigma factor [Roseibium aggregatum]MBN9672906.1 RNA polymerase sigma factor [Roseibium aggregatum]
MIRLDPVHVEAARQGDRAALDALVRAAERPVYNLAIRMLAHPADAEDATQEILIKIIANLGSLRDIEAAGGWAMRIACRHLVGARKSGRVESMRMSFTGFAADLEQGLSEPGASEPYDAETRLAIEEVKVGCTLAMLTCLSRDLRIAYLLGDVFELSDREAASVLEIAPAAYRQRLRRSRAAVTAFVKDTCGNVSAKAACRCEKRIAAAEEAGRISRSRSRFGLSPSGPTTVPGLRAQVRRLEEGRRAAALLRSNPDFSCDVAELVLQTIETNPIRPDGKL